MSATNATNDILVKALQALQEDRTATVRDLLIQLTFELNRLPPAPENAARIKVLETGISRAIDTCECRNQPGPNSCQRCRGLIRLLEGE